MTHTDARNGSAVSLPRGGIQLRLLPEDETLAASLAQARHHADIGSRLPEGARLAKPLRLLTRFVARMVLACSRFLVKPQRHFNRAALSSLDYLGSELSDVTEQLRAQARQVEALQELVRLQEQRLRGLRAEPGSRAAPSDGERGVRACEQDQALDSLYVALEERFRGNRDEIRDRLQAHLPFVQDAGFGSEAFPILDLGCGRGEWLELLQAKGLLAGGVDSNRDMAAECLRKGFKVHEADVIEHLRGLPGASLGLVTGFHLIEHLPLPVLVKLIDETVRVLRPGGAALFETPNPQNVLVGSWSFYLDPTHRNPLPSALSKFLLETRGLARVEVRGLHPFPESCRLAGSAVAERLNELLYGPRDYAVVGWKV